MQPRRDSLPRPCGRHVSRPQVRQPPRVVVLLPVLLHDRCLRQLRQRLGVRKQAAEGAQNPALEVCPVGGTCLGVVRVSVQVWVVRAGQLLVLLAEGEVGKRIRSR